ncbi:MAG: PAC2 family protein [Chloroflexi bacterium]|nr:PAC2 family protein [Chloroflexota bacterium]
MKNEFYYRKDAKAGKDLILFRSEQPTIKPYEYVGLVLDVACQFGVRRIYMVGAFGATGITHTEEPVVVGVVNQPHLRELLQSHDIGLYPEYKGIGSIQSTFLWFARERNIEAISLWAPMPYYIARLPSPWSGYPKCSLAILKRISGLESITLDTTEIDAAVKHTETEMGKVYDDLWEQAKKEFAYPNVELPESYTDEAAEPLSDEDVKGMIGDIEDFFKKGKE